MPDVLQIDDEDVDVLQHFCRRFARLAVERKDGHLAPRVALVRRFDHVVLQVRTKAVLRAKERRPACSPRRPEDDPTVCRKFASMDAGLQTRPIRFPEISPTIRVEELVYAERDDGGSGAGEGRHAGIIDLPFVGAPGASDDATARPRRAPRRSC